VLVGPGRLRLEVERREVMVGDISIDLTRLEFDLLHTLLLNAGRVLTRERLLEQVWGYDFAGDTRAVDSAIKRLRAACAQPTRKPIISRRCAAWAINSRGARLEAVFRRHAWG